MNPFLLFVEALLIVLASSLVYRMFSRDSFDQLGLVEITSRLILQPRSFGFGLVVVNNVNASLCKSLFDRKKDKLVFQPISPSIA